MKWISCILLSVILSSCAGEFEVNKLSDYKALNEQFTQTELKDLQTILDFYVQATCGADTLNKNKIVHCFMDQLQDFENSKFTGKLEVNIPFERQLELYDQLNQSTFDNLWRFSKNDNSESIDNDFLTIIHDGIFIKLMESLQKDYPRFQKLTKSIKAAGDISPAMFADLLLKHQEYNLFDDRVRLFFTLHYLTFNDQMKRSVGTKNSQK